MDKRRKRKKKEQNLRSRILPQHVRYQKLVIFCLAAAAVCICRLLYGFAVQGIAAYRYQKMRHEGTQVIVIEAEDIPAPESKEAAEDKEEEKEQPRHYCSPVKDFDVLQEENGDIYAWVTVPGTEVDYPVLQGEEDNYYLNRNLDFSEGYPGCIYSNSCNAKDFSDYLTILYGHNMKNGSMFGSLHSFEDEEFFQANREIILYAQDRRLTYEIIAALTYDNSYIPAFYDVATQDGADAFWQSVQSCRESPDCHILKQDASSAKEEADYYLVLSTCVKKAAEKRYLVIGQLKEEAFYIR